MRNLNKTILTILFCLLTQHSWADFNISASRISKTGLRTDYAQSFSSPKLFSIPDALSMQVGQPGNNTALFRFSLGNGSEVSCIYLGDGSRASSSNSCSYNGTLYRFNFCTLSSNYAACTINPTALNGCKNDPKRNLLFAAGDTIIASSIRLELTGADNCTTQSQISMTLKNYSDACGGIAWSTIQLMGPLSCPRTTSQGLAMLGNGNTLLGHGFSISAPLAGNGLFLTGNNVTVDSVKINGISNGSGILAFDTNSLVVQNSETRSNLIGITVSSYNTDTSAVKIISNNISNNSLFNLRFIGSELHKAQSPMIQLNNLGGAGDFAIALDAGDVRIYGTDGNSFKDSTEGISFNGKNLTVDGIDFSTAGLKGAAIFVTSADNVTVTNSKFGTSAPALSSQQRIAGHFYNIRQNLNLYKNVATKLDVGFKLAIDLGFKTSVYATCNTLTSNTVAGLMIQSYSPTNSFKLLNIGSNNLSYNPKGYGIWIVDRTKYDAGYFYDNKF